MTMRTDRRTTSLGASGCGSAGRAFLGSSQVRVHRSRDRSDLCPGMMLVCETSDRLPMHFRLAIQMAGKKAGDGLRETAGIPGGADESGFSLDDVVPEGAHVGRDGRQAEIVPEK